MPSKNPFECINCGRERDAGDAVSLSWPTHVGWFVLKRRLAGSVCPDCKESVTYVGTAIALFLAFAGISLLVYAIAKWSHLA
jgi:Zn ribbon nucleic-acid-binding protein